MTTPAGPHCLWRGRASSILPARKRSASAKSPGEGSRGSGEAKANTIRPLVVDSCSCSQADDRKTDNSNLLILPIIGAPPPTSWGSRRTWPNPNEQSTPRGRLWGAACATRLNETLNLRTFLLTLKILTLFSAKDMHESERPKPMTIYGYARVSTDGQTLAAQEAALAAAGAVKIYAEKVSGAVTERRALAKALTVLGEGGTLIVTP
jgi:hypothetical protein